jgi:hypothetical protein
VNIERIGEREEFIYRLEPAVVSLIITAPQPVLEDLTADDVRVTVDLSGLGASGTYTLVPVASLLDQNVEATIAILPAQIDVAVENINGALEATAEP